LYYRTLERSLTSSLWCKFLVPETFRNSRPIKLHDFGHVHRRKFLVEVSCKSFLNVCHLCKTCSVSNVIMSVLGRLIKIALVRIYISVEKRPRTYKSHFPHSRNGTRTFFAKREYSRRVAMHLERFKPFCQQSSPGPPVA